MEKLQQQYEELKGDLLQKIFVHRKGMETAVNAEMSHTMFIPILERNIKNTKKKLTSIFRKQNSNLIAQYKQSNQAYKQAGGVDEPKYIQDKQSLEKLGIDVDEAIANLSERDQDIMKTYFAGEDIRKCGEKYELGYQRVRQTRNHLIRKIEQQSKEQIQ